MSFRIYFSGLEYPEARTVMNLIWNSFTIESVTVKRRGGLNREFY